MGGQRHTPASLPPANTCTRYPLNRRLGGPYGLSEGMQKTSPHRDSIPGSSSPWRVAIPTELSRPTSQCTTAQKNVFTIHFYYSKSLWFWKTIATFHSFSTFGCSTVQVVVPPFNFATACFPVRFSYQWRLHLRRLVADDSQFLTVVLYILDHTQHHKKEYNVFKSSDQARQAAALPMLIHIPSQFSFEISFTSP